MVAGCYSSFDDSRLIYAELARVVRPGGKLFVRTFAQGCWGDETGARVGRDMWACAEGHLVGHGATRFTKAADVAGLLAGWSVDRVEHSSITEDGGRHQIKHLLIYASRR